MKRLEQPPRLGRIALAYLLILGTLMLAVVATDSSGTKNGLLNFLGMAWVWGSLVLDIAWDRQRRGAR